MKDLKAVMFREVAFAGALMNRLKSLTHSMFDSGPMVPFKCSKSWMKFWKLKLFYIEVREYLAEAKATLVKVLRFMKFPKFKNEIYIYWA